MNRKPDYWIPVLLAASVICGLVIFFQDFQSITPPVHAQVMNQGRRFGCVVSTTTTTALTAVGGDCGAVQSGDSLFITDIAFGSSGASSTSADALPSLFAGTGTNCATTSTLIWLGHNPANSEIVANLSTPIEAGNALQLCWIDSASGTKSAVIGGWISRATK